MKQSQLLSITTHVWPGYVHLNLLLSDENIDFHHSMIYNPTPELVQYGDKAVRHWSMQGSAEPKFDQDVNWNGHEGPMGSNSQENWWFGGTTVSYYEVWNIWEGVFQKDKSARMVRENNAVYYEQWDWWTDTWWRDPDPICEKIGNHWIKSDKPKFSSWLLRPISYEVGDPAPYYWMSYMYDKKPAINPGALSELIRNTIQDATSLSTNNFANAAEIAGLITDFRNGKIKKLCEDFSSFKKLVANTRPDLKGKRLRVLTDRSINKVYNPRTMKSDYVFSAWDLNRPGINTTAKATTKKLASGWLKYRYAYSTTKMDVENFIRQTLESSLGTLTDERVLRGKMDVNGGEMHLKMRLHERSGDLLLSIMNTANKAGFFPGLYNLWDMIPFSFVVDWFTDVGDTLEDFDQRWMHDYFIVDELLVSTKQRVVIDDAGFSAELKYYDRELYEEMPQFEFYKEEERGTSDKVAAFRSVDGVSLVVGAV